MTTGTIIQWKFCFCKIFLTVYSSVDYSSLVYPIYCHSLVILVHPNHHILNDWSLNSSFLSCKGVEQGIKFDRSFFSESHFSQWLHAFFALYVINVWPLYVTEKMCIFWSLVMMIIVVHCDSFNNWYFLVV